MIYFKYKIPVKNSSCVGCDFLVEQKNLYGKKFYSCADALWEKRKIEKINNIPQKTNDCIDNIIYQKKEGNWATWKIVKGYLIKHQGIPDGDNCDYTNGCLGGYCDFWTVIGKNTDACALFLKKTNCRKLRECREMLLG